MGEGRKIRWFAAAVMLMAGTAAVPGYAEPVPETGGYIGTIDNIRDYEGIVTDEMMEGQEEDNNTENPTDLYGSKMEWDVQGSGREDEAGYETDADMMEAPTYSAKEQEEILESFRTADETETAGKGWLRIRGNLGDGWPGYNITVALYDESQRRVETTLYSQDGFVTKRELPAGRYKIYRAYVPGDENGSKYPLIVSDSSIEVEQNKTAELTVWRAADIRSEKEITEPEYQKEPEMEQPSAWVSGDIQVAAGIGFVLVIFLVSGLAVYRRKITCRRYE